MPDDAPEDWEIFKEYNRQDVVTEREIRRRLLWLKPSRQEHRLWLVDRAINDRGIGIDRKLVESAIFYVNYSNIAIVISCSYCIFTAEKSCLLDLTCKCCRGR